MLLLLPNGTGMRPVTLRSSAKAANEHRIRAALEEKKRRPVKKVVARREKRTGTASRLGKWRRQHSCLVFLSTVLFFSLSLALTVSPRAPNKEIPSARPAVRSVAEWVHGKKARPRCSRYGARNGVKLERFLSCNAGKRGHYCKFSFLGGNSSASREWERVDTRNRMPNG